MLEAARAGQVYYAINHHLTFILTHNLTKESFWSYKISIGLTYKM